MTICVLLASIGRKLTTKIILLWTLPFWNTTRW